MKADKKMLKMLAVVAGVVLLAQVVPAGATSIAITNYSFETPATANYTHGPEIPGWTADMALSAQGVCKWTFGGGTRFPNWETDGGPQDGNQYGYMYITQPTESMTTTNAVTTIASGTDYTLTVALGYTSVVTPATYTLELLANDVSVASFSLSDAATAIPNQSFKDYSVVLNAAAISSNSLAGQNLKIRIAGSGSNSQQVLFDNVRLDASTVPEPATMAMLGLGGVMMLVRGRRRK